jgi:putative SOS response-associated peptidase YedK
MCGYARRHIQNDDLKAFVDAIGMMELFRGERDENQIEHFYPAFGGAANRQISDLIIREDGEIKTVDATWWFECKEVGDQLLVDNTRTTFNARNLVSPYWRGAIRHHRAIVLATGLGEGKLIDGKNRHFYMQGETPLLMGAVYRPFSNGLYSTAIITRDAHSRFSEYHDKAFPLFLPPDSEFLKLWLSNEPESHPEIARLLENPKVFNALTVTQVKTFKGGQPLSEPKILLPD